MISIEKSSVWVPEGAENLVGAEALHPLGPSGGVWAGAGVVVGWGGGGEAIRARARKIAVVDGALHTAAAVF